MPRAPPAGLPAHRTPTFGISWGRTQDSSTLRVAGEPTDPGLPGSQSRSPQPSPQRRLAARRGRRRTPPEEGRSCHHPSCGFPSCLHKLKWAFTKNSSAPAPWGGLCDARGWGRGAAPHPPEGAGPALGALAAFHAPGPLPLRTVGPPRPTLSPSADGFPLAFARPSSPACWCRPSFASPAASPGSSLPRLCAAGARSALALRRRLGGCLLAAPP